MKRGFDFIMLVTGLIHSKLREVVNGLRKPSISTFDIIVKAWHIRMVIRDETWQLHNTRMKDLLLLQDLGFFAENIY